MLQQDITPSTTAESPESHQGNKRRKPISTTRGVASLTPDQLAKKRANDREAQRAIRERTKAQIETLERKIQDLTAQQPYQELQAVIRQKDAVQAENEEIKRRLTSILSIIQPLIGAQGLTELATAAHGNVQFGGNENTPQQHPFLNGERQPGSRPISLRLSPHQAYSQWQGNEAQPSSSDRLWQSSVEALNNQRTNLHRGLELNESGERLSFNFLLENQKGLPSILPPIASSYPPIPNAPYTEQPRSSWSALPKNLPPTCPLDGILLKFLHTRQHDLDTTDSPHGDHHHNSHTSPSYPSVHSLLNPTLGHPADPLSQVMIDIISKFPGISGLSQQVAILYLMFLLMRWCLHPTQQNYERLPEWLTPRPSQLFEAHPAWIDYVPWPKMRDKLVANYRDYPFENWFIPFTTGISVNWPYEEMDCLLSTSEREEPIINPVFERHCLRIENWSVGPGFVEAFPALADLVRVSEKR